MMKQICPICSNLFWQSFLAFLGICILLIMAKAGVKGSSSPAITSFEGFLFLYKLYLVNQHYLSFLNEPSCSVSLASNSVPSEMQPQSSKKETSVYFICQEVDASNPAWNSCPGCLAWELPAIRLVGWWTLRLVAQWC